MSSPKKLHPIPSFLNFETFFSNKIYWFWIKNIITTQCAIHFKINNNHNVPQNGQVPVTTSNLIKLACVNRVVYFFNLFWQCQLLIRTNILINRMLGIIISFEIWYLNLINLFAVTGCSLQPEL